MAPVGGYWFYCQSSLCDGGNGLPVPFLPGVDCTMDIRNKYAMRLVSVFLKYVDIVL
jgi:hypothetical protein